jgi:hypothetical protein
LGFLWQFQNHNKITKKAAAGAKSKHTVEVVRVVNDANLAIWQQWLTVQTSDTVGQLSGGVQLLLLGPREVQRQQQLVDADVRVVDGQHHPV